jgi:hypothetical protein
MPLKFSFAFILLVSSNAISKGQDSDSIAMDNIHYRVEEDGDTLFYSVMEDLFIFPEYKPSTAAEKRRYTRLIFNVKKAYPYAKMASAEYKMVSEHILTLTTDRERRLYINEVEKNLLGEYEEELKKLTITQGRILLKLVDREVGETSYDILKDLKGSFTAVFWQTLARIFGNNLKSEFDPDGEDKLLNEIVIQIENGQL